MSNKELVEKYPFLLPRNVWTGEVPEDYDYSYTQLDYVPEGWKDLALKLCEELKIELTKANYLDKYRISQIKEKWGRLCWYDFGNTENGYHIINKYATMSERICIECGSHAEYMSRGWISPYCHRCAWNELPDEIAFDQYYDPIDYTKEEEEQ